MNTSPEAKQAAEEWGKDHTVYEREYFAQGYDAATAKLREELEATRDVVIRLVKLARQQPSLADKLEQIGHERQGIVNVQPSATTPDEIDEENYRELERAAAKKYGPERKL